MYYVMETRLSMAPQDKKEQKSDFKHNLLIEDSVQCFDDAIVQKLCQTNRGAIMLSGSDQTHQVNITPIPIMHQTTIKQTDQTPAALELRDKFQLKPFICSMPCVEVSWILSRS